MHLTYDLMHNDVGGFLNVFVVAENVDKEGEGMVVETFTLGQVDFRDDVDLFLTTATPRLTRTSDWQYDDKSDFPFWWAKAINSNEGSTV